MIGPAESDLDENDEAEKKTLTKADILLQHPYYNTPVIRKLSKVSDAAYCSVINPG